MPDEVIDDLEIEGEGLEKTSTEVTDPPTDPPVGAEGEQYAQFIESLGGQDLIKQAKGLYDIYAGEPSSFDPKVFWKELADISDTRYDAVVLDMFDTHKDFFAENMLGLKPADLKEFNAWKAAGKPTVETDQSGMSDKELQESDEPWAAELLKHRIEARQSREWQVKQDKEQEVAKQTRYQQWVNQEVSTFATNRLSAIDKELDKIKLGDDPLGKNAALAIKAMAQMNFYDDPNGGKTYNAALDHIRNGEPRLATNLSTAIDVRLGKHIASSVAFITDLLQAKRELDTIKRGKVDGRLEIPQKGTSPATTAPSTSKPAEAFNMQAYRAKLNDLRASGAFGK